MHHPEAALTRCVSVPPGPCCSSAPATIGVMSCANLSASWPLAAGPAELPVLWVFRIRGFDFNPKFSLVSGVAGAAPPVGCDFEDGEAGFAHPLSLNSSPVGQAPSRSPSGKRRRCCTRQGRAPRGENFLALPARADVCAANPFLLAPDVRSTLHPAAGRARQLSLHPGAPPPRRFQPGAGFSGRRGER